MKRRIPEIVLLLTDAGDAPGVDDFATHRGPFSEDPAATEMVQTKAGGAGRARP